MSTPRLGFIGLGWIGAMRLDAVAESGRAEIVALCDAAPERLEEVGRRCPDARRFTDADALFQRAGPLALDGVVVATPNTAHAPQVSAALERGLAVFCQKPLGVDASETRALVETARRRDRLLGVDYSYRFTDGARTLRALVAEGALGRIFRVESVFHNAYGPDKAWCYDPARSGGGALMDLGVHQVDMPLWLLGHPDLREVRGRVYRDGEPAGSGIVIDDFAVVRMELEGGASVDVAVSWNAHAGRDCVYRVTLFGTEGGAELRNVDGSFYDFEVERFHGTAREHVGNESGGWLGRGILDWVERLAASPGYDPEVEHSVTVAGVVDRAYGRARAVVA